MVEGFNPPYQFPDTALEDKPHMMGSLSSKDFFAMPWVIITNGLGYYLLLTCK